MVKALLIAILMLYPSLAYSLGYTARSCGFDMNRNGIIGEAADCNVCDGVTTDPDGDSTNEDLIYTNASTGNDSTGDGSFATPYKTIQKALDVADGPGDGAEDIICIAGTFTNEKLSITQSGVTGNYTRDSFEFPNNPLMIVGTDGDNDGSYPPFDTDDTAVMDGAPTDGIAIDNLTNRDSYLEFAHFTIQDYSGATSSSAFQVMGGDTPDLSHIYIHDMELKNINKDQTGLSGHIVFTMFSGDAALTHFAIINVDVDQYGGYFMRGTPVGSDFRFKDLTLTVNGLDNADGFAGFKLWFESSGIEVLDSLFDANLGAWTPDAGTFSFGIGVFDCSQNWTIRGNKFIDFKDPIVIDPFSAGACLSRTVDGIVIDQNNMTLTTDTWSQINSPFNNPRGVVIWDGPNTTTTVIDVTITNNMFSSQDAWGACVSSQAGNNSGTQLGTITIAGNTCYGPFETDLGGYGGIRINDNANSNPQNNYVIKNNIIANTGGDDNISVDYAPSNFIADGNVYDDSDGFTWNGSIEATFALWKTATSQDANSSACDPTLVSPAGANLHLDGADACATGAGVDITSITTVDFDGDTRVATNSDVGADETAVVTGFTWPIVLHGTPSWPIVRHGSPVW